MRLTPHLGDSQSEGESDREGERQTDGSKKIHVLPGTDGSRKLPSVPKKPASLKFYWTFRMECLKLVSVLKFTFLGSDFHTECLVIPDCNRSTAFFKAWSADALTIQQTVGLFLCKTQIDKNYDHLIVWTKIVCIIKFQAELQEMLTLLTALECSSES